MKIEYIVANPSGNITLLVLNPVARALHSTVADRLLRQQPAAEQVGYLTLAAGKPLRVDMMGGEFCGNASRSAAAYALQLAGKAEASYDVSCSGCADVLQTSVTRQADGSVVAQIEMPMPEAIEAVIVDVGGLPSRFFRIALPGIVHFVHIVQDIEQVDKALFWQALYDYAKDEGNEAFGLILFDPTQLKMIPAVYVTATDTLYWENSCGSGSAAVAATLATLGKRNVSCDVKQPGGAISIAASVQEGTLRHLYIGGPVTLSDVQETLVSI